MSTPVEYGQFARLIHYTNQLAQQHNQLEERVNELTRLLQQHMTHDQDFTVVEYANMKERP